MMRMRRDFLMLPQKPERIFASNGARTAALPAGDGQCGADKKDREPPSGFPALALLLRLLQTLDPPRGQPVFLCIATVVGRRVTDENIRWRGF
jgi:hypothetical protein